MRLNNIKAAEGARQARRRVGRGVGSGMGKTSGRGHKGQKSRSGGFHKVGFEGGQMPLYQRMPKRGFVKPNRKQYAVVNLGLIQKFIDAGKIDAKGEEMAGLSARLFGSDEAREAMVAFLNRPKG